MKKRKHGLRGGNNSNNPNRKQKNSNMRTKQTINRLNMYKNRPVRTKSGKLVGGALMLKTQAGGKDITGAARVAPDRRWFGNTRVIGQRELDQFREKLGEKVKDPYSVVLRTKKLPMSLLQESEKVTKMHLLSTESYSSVFGPKRTRKRPKIASATLTSLMQRISKQKEAYEEDDDRNIEVDNTDGLKKTAKEEIFDKGQSKRIWAELYKVLDCSDVVIMVLDVRDPMGTRCSHVEKYLKKHARHKHVVLVLNKCDLVPPWITRKWTAILSKEYPTVVFHASIRNPFGKGTLINLLRQFSVLHKGKMQISVGFIGYPNVGKSSIINTLSNKKVCRAAPIPGETKVWQYVTLMKRIHLIDCPGVVYNTNDSETMKVLKGVVRSERLQMPEVYIDGILDRVKPEYMSRMYGVDKWSSPSEFLVKLARQSGKLLKGGEPDLATVARRVINDLQRGRLPYFVPPPAEAGAVEDRSGGFVAEQNLTKLHKKIVQKVEFSIADQHGEESDEEDAKEGQQKKRDSDGVAATKTGVDAAEGDDEPEDIWDDLDL